jgi:hypothetical protein
MNAIQQLSDNDKPAYFGLPANVERSWQRITSHEVINQLKSKFTRSVHHESAVYTRQWIFVQIHSLQAPWN